MKILLFSYYNPLGKGGFEKQAMGLTRQLVSQGHQVACLTVATPEYASNIKFNLEESKLFSLGCYVIPHEEKSYSLRASILFWFNRSPAKFLASQHPQLQKSIAKSLKEICQEKEIDVIHCLSLRTTYFLPDFLEIPTVIDLVDSFTQHKKRALQYFWNKQKWTAYTFGLIDFLKAYKIEKNILNIYANSAPFAVVSKIDVQLLKNISPPADIRNIAHPINLPSKTEHPIINYNEGVKILVFYGFLNQLWNIDALDWLVTEIIPLVLEQDKPINLWVTGFGMSEEFITKYSKISWIKIVQKVEDVYEFVCPAILTCWPFKYGTGVKNKILESMAMGKPVVTTTIGVEAFTESQKQGLLIGDNAQALANHIVYLLNNPDECTRLGNINREVILTEFTWEKKARDYLELYQLAKQKLSKKEG